MRRGVELRETPAAAGRWHVIRYEDLHANPRSQLTALLGFLELDATPRLVDDLCDQARIELYESRESGKHWRAGRVGDWRDEFTHEDVALFKHLAGRELGSRWVQLGRG